MKYLARSAEFTPDQACRLTLLRVWALPDKRPRAAIIMLNPSKADGQTDDPTIRSCVRLFDALGYGGVVVVNLFPYRATNPRDLAGHEDDAWEANRAAIIRVTSYCAVVVCAWGAHPVVESSGRGAAVQSLLREQGEMPLCFGRTKGLSPRHPLYIKTGTQLVPYS